MAMISLTLSDGKIEGPDFLETFANLDVIPGAGAALKKLRDANVWIPLDSDFGIGGDGLVRIRIISTGPGADDYFYETIDARMAAEELEAKIRGGDWIGGGFFATGSKRTAYVQNPEQVRLLPAFP